MTAACIPHDEAERLAALRRLNLLDTAPAESFERVTRLAAAMLRVPMVLVSLVDEDRQWFKSHYGIDATETPREVSFCAHAVYERRPLVIPDATADARFADNSLVTGPPHIRGYLGVPIFTHQGHAIGTLCAIDTRPHAFDAEDVARLTDYANLLEQAIHAQELAQNSHEVLRFAEERERLFRDTFEQAAVGITHTDLSGRLLRVNQRLCDMLGFTTAELQDISFIDITHPDDVPGNVLRLQGLLAGEVDSYQIEKRYRRKDGSFLWTNLSVALKRAAGGQPDYIIAVIENIEERKRADAELLRLRDSLQLQVAEQTVRLQSTNDALHTQIRKVLHSERQVRHVEHRLRAIANHIPALIGYWNHELRCEFTNEVCRQWFGIDPLKVIGMHLAELLGAEHFATVEPHIRAVLKGQPQRFESRGKTSSGVEILWDVQYIPDCSTAGDVRGFYVMAADNTLARRTQRALEAAIAQLRSDSMTDYLTALSNRRVFSERSEEACRRFHKSRENYGLILLDLDDFKQINDVYGHDAGDETLRTVGRVLKSELRDHRDVAARLGGEEFAILCFGNLDETMLRLLAERVRAQISQEIVRTGDRTFKFTASFGLAASDPIDSDWKTIYARADAALYEAKGAGKNRVAFSRASAFSVTGRFRTLRVAR